MDEIIKEVVSALSTDKVEGDSALPLEENDISVPISKDNFHSISSSSTKELTFVDGGNVEIFGAASFSLQFIRVGAVTYKEKRTSRKKEEFYLLITFKDSFKIKTFPNVLSNLTFDSLDPKLKTGNQRAVAEKVGGVCRRIAELKLANSFNSDFIVIDGDLYARSSQEEEILEKLKKKNVVGLSKTSNLMTKQGRVFSAAISNLVKGSWYYSPVYENGNVYFTKLHENSKHVFRVDMVSKKEKLFSCLQKLSSDPVFLGYPYPLIEVDKLARVSKQETEYLRTKFMTKFGKNWSSVKTYLRTKDAHEILDSIG